MRHLIIIFCFLGLNSFSQTELTINELEEVVSIDDPDLYLINKGYIIAKIVRDTTITNGELNILSNIYYKENNGSKTKSPNWVVVRFNRYNINKGEYYTIRVKYQTSLYEYKKLKVSLEENQYHYQPDNTYMKNLQFNKGETLTYYTYIMEFEYITIDNEIQGLISIEKRDVQ